MQKINRITKSATKALLVVFSIFTVAGLASIAGGTQDANAAVCGSEPASTTGKITQNITIPTSDTYTLWSRLKAPDANPVEYTAYIDGQCFVIGQSALTPSALTWIDYENGTSSDKATMSLSAGAHTLVLTAGTQDLELDRVMFLADDCVPSGTGDNCSQDSTAPTTSISSPSNAATVSSSLSVNASASDNDAVDRVEFYLNGSTLLGSDTNSPYTYDWDTTLVADGSYTLTVRAYDTSGNMTTSSVVTVTVANGTQPIDAVISSFTATPTSITNQPGQSSSLAWSILSGVNCTIDHGMGAVSQNGAKPVSPTVTTTYTISCQGQFGGNPASAQATITVTDAPDTDGDGIKDYIEQAAPNSGDANGDGTPDWQQQNVGSFMNSRTGSHNVVIATGDCTTLKGVSSAEGSAAHLMGVTSFSLDCASAGQGASVTVLFDKEYDTAKWNLFKVNGALTKQTDITARTALATKSVNGSTRTAVSYALTDGGDLDEDGIANGTIADPLAVTASASNIGAPDTGSERNGSALYLGLLVIVLTLLAGMSSYAFEQLKSVKSHGRKQ